MVITPLRESTLRGPIVLARSGDRLVLSQRPSRLFRVMTAGWALLIALMAWFAYAELAGGPTTTLTCNRATDTCALAGGSARTLPKVSQLADAELVMHRAHGEGDAYFVTLIGRDHTPLTVSPHGAVEASAVADARAAVDAIHGFLADPAQPRLQASWTFRASAWQKVRAVAYLVMSLLGMAMVLASAATRTIAFDRAAGQMTVTSKGPLRSSRAELPLAQIASVADRTSDGGVAIVMTDRGAVVIAAPRDPAVADTIIEQLRTVTAV